jgi:hypothetical protein
MNVNSVSKASEVTSDSGRIYTSSCDLGVSKRKENLLKGKHPNVFTGIGKLKSPVNHRVLSTTAFVYVFSLLFSIVAAIFEVTKNGCLST